MVLDKTESLWSAAVKCAQERGGGVFLTFEGEEYTLDDLLCQADALANQLEALGVAAGSNVAVMMPNCPEVLVSTLAIAALSAVEVPVNTALVGPMLAHVIGHSDSVVCILAASLIPSFRSLDLDGLSALRAVIVHNDLSEEGFPDLDGQIAKVPWQKSSDGPGLDGIRTGGAGWSDTAAILYTSGTTGPAKGVMLSHGYLLAQAQRRVFNFGFDAEDNLYTCLPLFHVNAKVITFLTAMLAGGRMSLSPRFRLSRFWDEITTTGATFFTFIGTMAVLLLDQTPSSKERSHRAKLAVGAPIPPNRFKEFEERFGVKIASGFGMTELMGALENPPSSDAPSSCGLPAKGYQAVVVDATFRECGVGEIGELVVRPPTPDGVMNGYYKQPDVTVEAFRGLWFHTGDLFQKDESGYFWFVDRQKDYLRCGGENISASEVERIICSQDEIVEAAVIGVPSERTEDDLKVIAVRRHDSVLTELALAERLREVLPNFAWPRFIEFVDNLPKTATTRVEKFKLRAQWRTPSTVEIPRIRRPSR